ncbi:MAG: hypothetical protein IJP08_03285 [Bacteroidaceae bacterium]|nr:hypothetical protein [Bacteroidaceae bacterium]
MNNVCGDNRFGIIAKAKEAILESTNIDTDEDEMKVLDTILFRCWQMGWLDKYDDTKKQTERIPAIEALSADAEQVTGKLNKCDDSLFTDDTETCKEQKSKLDLISRQDAIKTVCNAVCEYDVPHYPNCDQIKYCDEIQALISLPSADRPKIGNWVRINGGVTPGGTPVYICPNCGESEHLYGTEYPKRKVFCDKCGQVNVYPWEEVLEDE